jgi:RHS repeat-associated protein
VTGSAVRKYYSLSGQTVAMREGTPPGYSVGLKYFLTDHLGSTLAVLDSSGTVLSETRYLPFGAVRDDVGTISQTDFTYTSQRDLPDVGLMDYKARFYSPRLARFIQPDSLIPGAENPQSWNRYAYVGNNPLNYTDPSGHLRIIDDDKNGNPIVDLPRRERVHRQPEGGGSGGGNSGFNRDDRYGDIDPFVPLQCFYPSDVPSYAGYSNEHIDEFYIFGENFVEPINGIVELDDIYRLSSKGGWETSRYALNLGIIEAFVQGSRQAYRDSWYQTLSPSQRVLRPVVVGVEALITEVVAGKVGMGFGGAGLVVGGPLGAAGGQIAGQTFATKVMDRFWMEKVNPNVLPQLGVWP